MVTALPGGRDGDWLDFVADLMASPDGRWPPEQVSRLLVDTLDAAGGIFHAQSATGLLHRNEWPPELFAPHLEEQLHWSRHEAMHRHPLLRYHLATGLGVCLQVDDVPSGIADARTMADWRARGRRWGGVQSQVSLPVRFDAGGIRAFVVARTDPFTAQEMVTARRVNRLLRGLDRHFTEFCRWSAGADPGARDAASGARLTPRELVVLDLLAAGLTAASIGRRLDIAERTVQKHLQRIYRKLGAADRLGAVYRAQLLGLVRRP